MISSPLSFWLTSPRGGSGWCAFRLSRRTTCATFCSLLIHEGRSPLMVAAMMGHASGELIWRRYGHVFDEALASSVGMVDAIQAARKELEGSGTGRKRDAAMVRVLHAPLPTFKKRPLAGGK